MTVMASAKSPNYTGKGGRRTVTLKEFRLEAQGLPPWAHPEVVYWTPIWEMIRDCKAGEREIKCKTIRYLPAMEGQDNDDYRGFLERATFYNFTGRTIASMSGAIFRRDVVFQGLDDEQRDALDSITIDGQTFATYATVAAEEVFEVGRFGTLLELPAQDTPNPEPYFAEYRAEAILDWDLVKDASGRLQPWRIFLREGHQYEDPNNGARKLVTTYRELVIEEGVYKQYVYVSPNPGESAERKPEHRKLHSIPKRLDTPLDFIPFVLNGPFKNSWQVEKPPAQDIAALNVSHYRSYAQLEHGRYFTGFPIYYIEDGAQQVIGEAEYEIASNRVWKAPHGSKPGILEFNGQGLKHLENALDIKEQQASALGGKMMGIRAQATSESDNQLKLNERNEQSQLLKVARSLDTTFTQLLRWWAWWKGATLAEAAKIKVRFNKDFLFEGIGAREFRAVHAMYKDGVVPVQVLYHYLKRGDIIPDWMTIEEFTELLDSMDGFPNNPDFEARQRGYPDRQSEIDDENFDDALGSAEDIAEGDRDVVALTADKDRKSADKKADADRKASERSAKVAAKAKAAAPAPRAGGAGPRGGGAR